MSIRLDPRRLGVLKRLAADSGVRPGDLVRQWAEERIDADRGIAPGPSLIEQLAALAARLDAIERAPTSTSVTPAAEPTPAPDPAASKEHVADAAPASGKPKRRAASKVSAAPRGRVALHDEMIAVLSERGPMSAADLATAVVERGRYTPPRSGKPIDAAMISQRVSNPTYRARFTRNEGRIGLAG